MVAGGGGGGRCGGGMGRGRGWTLLALQALDAMAEPC